MLPMLMINEGDFSDKKVILRLDLNVPLKGNRIVDDTRICRSLPTIQKLLNQRAKIIILSHFGRPRGKETIADSLLPIAAALHRYVKCPILFGSDCIGEQVQEVIGQMCPSSILLLENLRFHAQEEKNEVHFAKELSSLGDAYINDAFSCSHRAHASIVGIPAFLPSYAGVAFEKEVLMLNELTKNPKKPIAAVIGGSKISTKLDLLTAIVIQMDYLVLGGGMSNTFLGAKGYSLGESLCEPELFEAAREIMALAARHNCQIVLPVDGCVSTSLENSESRICALGERSDIETNEKIFDIGPQSVQHIKDIIKECKTVLWNGPLGVFEVSPYAAASVALAEYVADLTVHNQLVSVAGGGDTLALLTLSSRGEDFTYTSTAGGAFLEWLEGKELPGITALCQANDRVRVPQG